MSNSETFGWKWQDFRGSVEELKWNRLALPTLQHVLKSVPQRRVVVQAGGNLGIFPKYLAKKFETVYTFEPAMELFPMMTVNAQEQNIIRFQAALGETHELIQTVCARRHGTSTKIHEGLTHVAGPGVIPTLRLDDLNLSVCDLLYLDLEGYEGFALRGARETLARCRPVVAVEINQNTEFYGVPRDDVRAYILAAGYRALYRMQSDEVFVPQEWPV